MACINPDIAGKERFCAEHNKEMTLHNVHVSGTVESTTQWVCLDCMVQHGKPRTAASNFIKYVKDEEGNIIGVTCPLWAALLPDNPW
jgi:hypothetical protein